MPTEASSADTTDHRLVPTQRIDLWLKPFKGRRLGRRQYALGFNNRYDARGEEGFTKRAACNWLWFHVMTLLFPHALEINRTRSRVKSIIEAYDLADLAIGWQ